MRIFKKEVTNYDETMPHNLSVAWRSRKDFFNFLIVDPPRGRPLGNSGVHRNGEYNDTNLFNMSFMVPGANAHSNTFLQNLKSGIIGYQSPTGNTARHQR